MYIEQIYTGCLAQASYYIESGNEAAIIDPIREPEPYLRLAQTRKAKIKYIFETHFHADFISGHLDLSDKTGAQIIFGPLAKPAYPAHIAKDKEDLILGNCKLRVLHTPGHTVESSCILLVDENNKEHAVFTGDTLFVGDVGRPDLHSGNKNKEELASMLFDSLNNVIKKLPDSVIVYPGHGAGSACGKNLGTEKYSTIGEQKKLNYALRDLSRKQFIEDVTRDLPKPPAYFFKDASINIIGYRHLDEVLRKHCKTLSVAEFKNEIKKGSVIVDARNAEVFGKGYIPGSINIGLDGEFAPWVGTLIDMDNHLIIVAEEAKQTEVITRLARIGYENINGCLAGGFEAWEKENLPVAKIETVGAESFENYIKEKNYKALDVRRYPELKKEKINDAIHIPLEVLEERMGELDANKNYIVFCKGGYRSMIAASILSKQGFKNLLNVSGGITKIKKYMPVMTESEV